MSPDSVKTHVKFKARHGLNYPLIADTGHLVCKEYGVWAKKSMFGKKYWGVNRTTFVIDTTGRIARVFEKVQPEGHAAEVMDALESVT